MDYMEQGCVTLVALSIRAHGEITVHFPRNLDGDLDLGYNEPALDSSDDYCPSVSPGRRTASCPEEVHQAVVGLFIAGRLLTGNPQKSHTHTPTPHTRARTHAHAHAHPRTHTQTHSSIFKKLTYVQLLFTKEREKGAARSTSCGCRLKLVHQQASPSCRERAPVTEGPKWETNIKYILKNAQQRILRKHGLPQELLRQFYTAVIESVLCSSITVWFGAATKRTNSDCNGQSGLPEKWSVHPQPTLEDLHAARTKGMQNPLGPSTSWLPPLPAPSLS
ncbi:uncharacterized protein LOC133409453 [Phycodurus eques]|uniref:uncharacterized protein LOC133409453 n=1 Tax=Phycodurus eques TaxID=693459 RepID=UPI002ACE5267|nr:uncharacterized protein LOC133409453 [Phycodurus eques]